MSKQRIENNKESERSKIILRTMREEKKNGVVLRI